MNGGPKANSPAPYLALDKERRRCNDGTVRRRSWKVLGLTYLQYHHTSWGMGSSFAVIFFSPEEQTLLKRVVKVKSDIVEHPWCATPFTSILSLPITKQVIIYYPSTMVKQEAWGICKLPKDWDLSAEECNPGICPETFLKTKSFPSTFVSIPHWGSLFPHLLQSWSRAGVAVNILCSSAWLIPDWPGSFRKQMEHTLGSCWAQKRPSSSVPSVIFYVTFC